MMKKVIFAVLAAVVMSLGLASCSSSPEEKLIDVMDDIVSVLKSTHLKTADDVKGLATKLDGLKEKTQKMTEELLESYKDMTPEELTKLTESMKPMEEKVEKLQKDYAKEMERLKKEAKDAGLELDDLPSLF